MDMKSPNSPLEILGFIFQSQIRPPTSLFHLAALLIKIGFIDIDQLLPRGEEEGLESYKAYCTRRLQKASKIGRINLAATGKALMNKDRADVSVDVDLSAALDMEREAVLERLLELENSKSLGLLKGLMAVDDWSHARMLLGRLNNPVEHVEICNALFRHMYKCIETADSKELFEMLLSVGPYMYRDTVLIQKVCRVVKEARLEMIEQVLGKCLLPCLHLVPANPDVVHEIWELLKLLPYEARYRLYGEWEDEDQLPMIVTARKIATLDTRRILKLLDVENVEATGRMVANLAHANPLTVFHLIVQQMESYKDMIPLVVDGLKYLSQLEFDVLEYVVLECLALAGRDKLKGDGLNLSDWLQSLAYFWGFVCKKYPLNVHMRGVIQYLINQLKRGNGAELVLLQQLMQQMANIQYNENMTEEDHQLDLIRNQALIKLRDTLVEHELAVPLLILVAQHRSAIVINAGAAAHIKMVSEEVDRCNGILLQYVQFLSTSIPASSYALLIPSLDELVNQYHLEPEVAFLIHRPVLRSSDSISWTDLLSTKLQSWDSSSQELYAAFWGLKLYDLQVPRKHYKSEMAKHSDDDTLVVMNWEKHEDHVESVHRRLGRAKDRWLNMMNMEFRQNCVIPRCTLNMPDAVYCAMFLNTLGTPFVNHINALICKILHPMICCRTEYEAGRLGKFLLETASWKSTSNESRITRILVQCLKSSEYMEIRNALILMTKISSVFPATQRSGISLEEQVTKIKGDERADLKLLAVSVGAALAARKASWITEKGSEPKCITDEIVKKPSVDHRKSRPAQRSGGDDRGRMRQNDAKRRREDERKCAEWEHTKRRKLNMPSEHYQPYYDRRRPSSNTCIEIEDMTCHPNLLNTIILMIEEA